jgi:hypothetical protein
VFAAESVEQAAAQALEGLPLLPEGKQRRFRAGHGESSAPGPGWVATGERFRDPTSGRVMRVWVDAVSGARHYVPDAM